MITPFVAVLDRQSAGKGTAVLANFLMNHRECEARLRKIHMSVF